MRRGILLVIAFCLLIAFFFHFYHFLKAKVTRAEFKTLTEEKLGNILNADVKIGRIKFGLLKHVALSGLEIDQSESELPVQIGVSRIIIKYDLLAFIKQKFRVPTEVILDHPTLDFKGFVSPFSLAGLNLWDTKGSIFKRIEMENGKVEIPLPFLEKKIRIEKIKGKAVLNDVGLVNIDFRGNASDLAEGTFAVNGQINPKTQAGKIRVDLEDVKFLDPRLPIEKINGSFEVSETEMVISKLHFLLRGIPVTVSGTILRPFDPKPAADLIIEVEERSKSVQTHLKIDLAEETISGTLHLLGAMHEFHGKIIPSQNGFEFQDLEFNAEFGASASIDITNGVYILRAERGLQRFETKINIREFELNIDLNFNHFKYLNYDITTSAKIKMVPLEPAWSQGDRRFDVRLTTNYFIFNYHPLKDFRAEFQLSENGLDPFTAEWGNACHLKGAFKLDEVPSLDFTVMIDSFDLKELPALGVHVMPISLEGKLGGKIRAVGPAPKPDISGKFAIEEGKIGDFRFDHADMSFFGEPPHLKVLDSKIVRKDNVFTITGEIDLSLENIFQKLKIESKDQIIIWKGLDVTSEIKSRSEVKHEGTSTQIPEPPGVGPSGNPGGGKINAEYAVGPGTLSVSAEESEDKERVVTVGPKLRF